MKKQTVLNICFCAATALLAAACGSEADVAEKSPLLIGEVTADGKRPFYFDFSTGDMVTRGAPETVLSKHVGVSSYLYAKGGTMGKPNFMWNEEVARSAAEGNKWRTRNAFNKPETGRSMKFMAYYPYTAQEGTELDLTLSGSDATGPTVLTYEVPGDVTEQQDVMSGESDVIDTDVEQNSLSITMKHRLAGIQFVTGDIGLIGRIESIALKGIYKRGTYTLGANAWQLKGDPEDVEFNINTDFQVTAITLADEEGGKQVITDGDNTLLMLPQQIPADAKMVIKFRGTAVGETEEKLHTLEAPLRSDALTEWEWGKIYRYKISIVSLALVYELETHQWEGGSDESVVEGKIVI